MKTSVVCRLKRQRRTPCKSALVVSLSKDQLERLGLRGHLAICRTCARVQRGLRATRSALADLRDDSA